HRFPDLAAGHRRNDRHDAPHRQPPPHRLGGKGPGPQRPPKGHRRRTAPPAAARGGAREPGIDAPFETAAAPLPPPLAPPHSPQSSSITARKSRSSASSSTPCSRAASVTVWNTAMGQPAHKSP